MNKDYKEFLSLYEAPIISEYVSNKYLQKIIIRYVVWKIERKWKRYQKRVVGINWMKENRSR